MPDLPGLADVSPLGHGGFADVLLGRQIHLERWVAAKVFRVTLRDPVAADRFRAECRTLGELDQYPHVITVHDAGVLPDGRPYLISERCDGSLADLVEMRGALPVDRAVEIGLTIARALLFAHSCGVLHGDVTPRNVLLRASGAPVLADFGLAVLREHRGEPVVGYTADHAAPETVLPGVVDEAADVFGLGSTLATVLSTRPPFPSAPSGEPARLALIEAGLPAQPPAVPRWLAGLLARMLGADPGRRPSMDEVVTTLAAGGPVAAVGPVGHPAAYPSVGPFDDDPTPPAGMPVAGTESTRLRGMVPGPRPGPPREPEAAPTRTGARALTPWLIVAAAAVVGAGAGAGWYIAVSAPASPPGSMAVPAAPAPAPTSAPAVAAPVQPTVAVDPPARYGGSDTPRTARRTAPRDDVATPAPVAPVAPQLAPVVVPPPSLGLPIDGGGDNGGSDGGDNGDGNGN